MNKVKLVSVSKPYVDGLENAEDLIAYCARVSNPSNQMNTETAPRLLKYLIKHKHFSPFEMVSMTVEIKTSRAIAAQILRHRSFSFQEFSQRYSEAVDICDIELRKQAETNRQSSSEVFDPMIKESGWFDAKLQPASDIIEDHFVDSLALYQRLINEGVAKESARMVLPLATETTMYMSGTIRSWLSYFNVRLDHHTQKEHRLIALEIAKILEKEFPTIAESCDNFGNFGGNFM